jgi:uncharacterized membrane protein YkvA (DUF1232 family)
MTNETPRLPAPQGNIIRQTLLQLRLIWRLMRDPRILWLLKLIPLGGVLYLFFPFDMLVDLAPIIGQLDDAGILLGSLWLFVEMCPPDVVKEHMDDLTSVTVKGTWKEEKKGETPEAGKEKLPEKTGEAARKQE